MSSALRKTLRGYNPPRPVTRSLSDVEIYRLRAKITDDPLGPILGVTKSPDTFQPELGVSGHVTQ